MAHKKGFVVGSKTGGFIGIYEIDQRDQSVSHVDTFKVDPKANSICGLGSSSDKSRLVISAKVNEPVPAGGHYLNGESFLSRMELF